MTSDTAYEVGELTDYLQWTFHNRSTDVVRKWERNIRFMDALVELSAEGWRIVAFIDPSPRMQEVSGATFILQRKIHRAQTEVQHAHEA